MLAGANISGARFNPADLTNAKFHGADLSNVAFINCVWPDKIYEEVHMDKNGLSSKELETIYRNLKLNTLK